uniref:SH2 domain-containing protein n=1 Tax=Hucho hucho TaxID=62062 RepID=A0A4W5R7B9_9TELE
MLQEKEWFAGNCNRKTAEDLLLQINKDGAFLIRRSSAQNARQPYTLAVLYRQKVYNIPIRFLEETRGYALGKEGKKNEEVKRRRGGKRGRVLNKGLNNELVKENGRMRMTVLRWGTQRKREREREGGNENMRG